MDLVIDVGNTQVKYAVFNNDSKLIISQYKPHILFFRQLQAIFEAYPQISKSIISNFLLGQMT